MKAAVYAERVSRSVRNSMMRISSAIILFGLLTTGCWPDKGTLSTYSFPAEWESHEAVWVSFFGGPMDEVPFEMVKAIAKYIPVKCIVPAVDIENKVNHKLAYDVRAKLKAMEVNLDRVEIVKADSLVQVRDTGPIFVKSRSGALHIVDFKWNNYGRTNTLDETFQDSYPFDALMAEQLQIPVIKSHIVMEGGAMEVNGKGTLLQVEAVTLQRNPGMPKEAIEAELKRVLGQKKIIWLKEGPAEDPHGLSLITENYVGSGVGGHVDGFCRFVNPSTILLAFPDSAEAARDPVKKITYDRMKVNYEILRNATDQDGKPFEIIKVPVPDVPYDSFVADTTWAPPSFRALLGNSSTLRQGDLLHWVPASSYLNYFVTNHLVLIPKYWQPGLPQSVKAEDERFRQIMERYYPEREIVSINSLALNNTAGGMHCWTQQQPVSQQ